MSIYLCISVFGAHDVSARRRAGKAPSAKRSYAMVTYI